MKKVFGIFVAFTAWLSLGFQFSITDISILNYFSYFTTLCNFLIAVSLTFSLLFNESKVGVFFTRLSVQTAIALYIFIVSLVYNSVLRGIWVLSGWQYILDNMVHVVVPILYLIYWILFRTKGILKWSTAFYWIIFPFIYLIYSLIRGIVIDWYPYPFLDASKFGYSKVVYNISLMLLVFLIAGIMLILITHSFRNNKVQN